ncbi:hypothetical protein QBC38DRAFT_227476 [Podospora fimiseda]|uniref:Uncharacterized protein n=1 Tax=Podospora fimiseda TaxID=252190 RepID=A0AAN7GTB4_9PEZI|nr:hypothetical protein QBC38DRAFT_227476 [Podospora fimiseda]
MEGLLSVPPDRGTIIGRALWKPRYIVVGGPSRENAQQATLSKLQSNRSSARDLSRIPTEGFYLSVYKSKDDVEPVQQHSIVSITDCQVQMMAHRKQGPVLPTLVMSIMPDPILDKLRKRRSSRTTGFTTTKETGPTTLLFRYVDNEPYTLQDWSRFIQQLIQPNLPGRIPIPLSPLTPASPTFVNPFSSRPGDGQRPGSGSASTRPGFLKGINQTHVGRDRPMTFSDSPSLRSKRSDISSATSSMTHAQMGFYSYSMMHPADLPSPATTIGTTIGEYQGEFIEGWTSAQGRSSTLSSPIRERGSVSSGKTPQATMPTASSPPGPRETILDRAFQLRCIPGTEEVTPGEEKLTSLARFDALMRDMDEKRKQREAGEAKMKANAAAAAASSQILEPKSAWDLDSDSSSDYDDDSDDSDGPIGDMDLEMEDRFSSPPDTSYRRALNYTAGRHDPPLRSPLTYNHEALMALSSNGPSSLRPQTGYSGNRSRPAMSQRTHSQPQLATIIASSPTTGGALLEASGLVSEDGLASMAPGSPPPLQRSATERQSTSSNKRLSFSEFTKRLSSTSSLLLVQTNNSTTSSRGSNSDADPQQLQSPPPPLHHLHPRAAPQPPFQQPQSPTSPQSIRDLERCGWRGSVGVFGGAEGGFL